MQQDLVLSIYARVMGFIVAYRRRTEDDGLTDDRRQPYHEFDCYLCIVRTIRSAKNKKKTKNLGRLPLAEVSSFLA